MSWRKGVVVGFILCAAVVGAIAADHSNPPLQDQAISTRQPVVPWRAAFNSSSVDGAAIANPYSFGTWSTISAEVGTATTGRACLNRTGQGEFQVLPLFTTAGATATIQLFSFDHVLTDNVPLANRGSLVAPGSAGINLGLAYNLAQDSGVRTFTLAATADTVKGTVSTASGAINYWYPDQTSGTTYYVGQKMRFTASGDMAYIPYVVTISGGTLVLLVRSI